MTTPIIDRPPTFTEFANSPAPWLPDQPLWEQNAGSVGAVSALVAQDYPHVAEVVTFDPTVMPPKEQRVALWKLWMGRQHGRQDGEDGGKVEIRPERREAYMAALGGIAIGEKPLMKPIDVDPNVEYHQALANCGTPEEDVERLKLANKPNVKEIVMLTGQRKRGMWSHIESEKSAEAVLNAIATKTGKDIDAVWAASPFLQEQLMRPGADGEWTGPLPTEYEIVRTAVEAEFFDLIDWGNYEETVVTQPPVGANEETHYMDGDRLVTVPPREEGAVTYHLTDGRKVHVVNGAAVARPNAAPRANSTSIAEEAMHYVPVPDKANVVAITAVPHFRGGMDTIIAYLKNNPGRIARADIAASKLGPNTDLVAALGELMATMKADARLRALLRGGNPDSAELLDI